MNEKDTPAGRSATVAENEKTIPSDTLPCKYGKNGCSATFTLTFLNLLHHNGNVQQAKLDHEHICKYNPKNILKTIS